MCDHLTGWQELEKHKECEAHAGAQDPTSAATGLASLKDFPASVKALLTNPTFMCINFALSAEGRPTCISICCCLIARSCDAALFVSQYNIINDTSGDQITAFRRYFHARLLSFVGIVISGMSTWLPKYLESQFSLQASTAALYVGKLFLQTNQSHKVIHMESDCQVRTMSHITIVDRSRHGAGRGSRHVLGRLYHQAF